MELTGAQILMECLLEQGVDTVFGYPGGAVLNIYDALYQYRDRIRHITTAHEQAAAHGADGYARASGRTGVCIATSGPGAANLVTGIATAFMDSTPMVAVTGNVNRDLLGKSSFQELDIASIVRPITKLSRVVMGTEDLAGAVRDAFRIANEGRKGPVLLDLPKDITAGTCSFQPQPPAPLAPPPQPDPKTLEAALELLRNCRRPFIYTGGGVIAAGASQALKEFAERLDGPVSSSLMCQGGYDQMDGRYIGMLGMHGTKTASLAIRDCDLLVAVGTRFSDRVTCNAGLFARHCPIVQIDIDAREFGKNVPADACLHGDVRQVLEELNRRLEPVPRREWMERIAAWQAEYPPIPRSEPGVNPRSVMEALGELTGGEALISTEVGQHQMWAAQYFAYRFPRQLITSGGLGTMGFGLGAAIGAKLACPERAVVNIAGDGSFHMNANELSTLAKYQIPLVELVLNNQVLGMVRQWQKLFYGSRFSETNLEKPTSYEALARAYGIEAMTIRREEEIRPVLRQALELGRPVLVNCHIGQDENVLPMVPAGASVEDPLLDMPDLPGDETVF